MSVAYFGCPIHVFSCYFPPRKDENTQRSFNTLSWWLKSLLKQVPNSRVIVMGDFNCHLNRVQQLLAGHGIKPTFDNN